MCESQNMTVGVSFGEARQAAFEWAGAREKHNFPEHLWSPAVNPGKHKNVVLSLTLPDSSTYTFGRDVNLLWKHGILAEKAPAGQMGGRIDVEEGRISIIAWGWVDQYDELDQYLSERTSSSHAEMPSKGRPEVSSRSHLDENVHQQRGGRGRGDGWSGEDRDGRCRGVRDGRGRGGLDERERHKERRDRSYSPRRERQSRGGDFDRTSYRQDERGGRNGGERGGDERRRDDRDRPVQHGGIDPSDPAELARREARAAKFGPKR